MSHKHHNCSCPHENVKYCKTCRLVHCEDCNQEWTTKPASTSWGYNVQPFTTGTFYRGLQADTQQQNILVTTPVTTSVQTDVAKGNYLEALKECKHK